MLDTIRKSILMVPADRRWRWLALPVLAALMGVAEGGAAAAVFALIKVIADPAAVASVPIAGRIAPLLPYSLLLFSLALTVRRLIDRPAYPFAFLALLFAGSTNGMFMPERIDHHGWQLALLALSMAGIADPKRVRGGLTLGVSTALSP